MPWNRWQATVSRTQIVWLNPLAPTPAAVEPSRSREEPPARVSAPPPVAAPAERPAPKPQTRSTTLAPERQPRTPPKASPSPKTNEHVPAAETVSGPTPRVVPKVDWEKERQRAAASVVEEDTRAKAGRKFSLDDLAKPTAPPRDAPLVQVPKDHCAIATSKLERFALQMLGRCVRDARGDLFAAIKPDYLRSHPVCEAAADAPPTFVDARGNEYSTTKCRLVVDEHE